jgi:hypothetical protein
MHRTGFIAFTTIGYGASHDFYPVLTHTPVLFYRRLHASNAGGAIGLRRVGSSRCRYHDHSDFWCVLISFFNLELFTCCVVISEAFSSKYHSALHAGVFERAVKRYRERARTIAEKARRGKNKLISPASPSSLQPPPLESHQSTEDVIKDMHTRTQSQLEALPHKILADAKMFHEHMSYFVGPGNKVTVDSGDQLPPGLQQLMNEITGVEKLGERIKREILQDEDARHASVYSYARFGSFANAMIDVVHAEY